MVILSAIFFLIVVLVKIAIAAGLSQFSIVGGHDSCQFHYVLVGQPVWDVKIAEYMSRAGDVLTSASAWVYVNESDYCTQPCGDGRHTKASRKKEKIIINIIVL